MLQMWGLVACSTKYRKVKRRQRALNRAETNYCTTDKELLAARYFIEYCRQYLLGKKFIVRSDHQSLVWLFKLKEPRGKIARWIEVLSQYDFEIQYRPGKNQSHCDALSRCENPRACVPNAGYDGATEMWPMQEMLQASSGHAE